jgi:lysophospholipase L1-like esterase
MKIVPKSAFTRRLGAMLPVLLLCFMLAGVGARAASLPGLKNVHRLLFLGDSITYAGLYVNDIHAYVVSQDPDSPVVFLNLGLSSETVSGLTEPGHAGGKFPRPDLHERLARILAQTKPDLVLACYGMNDGIYQPLDGARFQKFREGMNWLHEQVLHSGAKIIHLTPPTYDPLAGHATPFADGTDYNTVLNHYAAWLLDQRTNHWEVIDLHFPMNQFLARERKSDPTYPLTKDGIHPGPLGHWLMAREILVHLGAPAAVGSAESVDQALPAGLHSTDFLKTVTECDTVLRNAWLTKTKVTRPGVKPGLPLPEAEAKAAQLSATIRSLARLPTTP